MSEWIYYAAIGSLIGVLGFLANCICCMAKAMEETERDW